MKATITPWLDTRKAKHDETYPVKIEIFFDGETYRFGIGESCTIEEGMAYDCRVKADLKRNASIITRLTNSQKSQKKRINDAVTKAKNIVAEMGEGFDFDKFLLQFRGKATRKLDLFDYWNSYIKSLHSRPGTAKSYESALIKFKRFICHRDNITFDKEVKVYLPFKELTVEFFTEFEDWVVEVSKRPQEKAMVSVGIYCRSIRIVINKAIKENLMPDRSFFGEDGYTIPGSGDDLGIGLPKEQLDKIFSIPLVGRARYYRDIFELMYRLNGSYPAEITYLRWEHQKHGKFVFPRRKTILTAKKNKKTTPIVITPRIKEIIALHGYPESVYIFDIINDNMTPEEKKKRQEGLVGGINRTLESICKKLDIPVITAKYARHSFSSLLAENGYGVKDIADLIKNSSLDATSRYVTSLMQDRAERVANLLD